MPVMSVKPKWHELVDNHGHSIEHEIGNGSMESVLWYGSEFTAFGPIEDDVLTDSEMCAKQHIKDTFDIHRIRRPMFGVDFIYGNVGFEVKSSEYEAISPKQEESIEYLEVAFLVVATEYYAQISERLK